MMDSLKYKKNLEKCNLKIWIKKILLLLMSTVLVLFIKPPVKHYTLKDYDKFTKEHNIEYEIINCPECGTKVPDTLQFCFNCNAVLFNASEETMDILKKINETLRPTPKEQIITISKKVIIYVIIIYIVYFLLKKIFSLVI